jgi:hypothetical protein
MTSGFLRTRGVAVVAAVEVLAVFWAHAAPATRRTTRNRRANMKDLEK